MTDSEPKYQQVIEWVKDKIVDGSYKPGDRLMSEMELSKMFGLSRQTIRRATGELENQNYVTRVQGSGTYIGGSSVQSRQEHYMCIAVISTYYDSYIFPPTLKGIERILSGSGYSMQVSFTDNKIKREEQILKDLLERDNIDGLIVEAVKSSLPNPNIVFYRKFMDMGIPVIFFNSSYPELPAPCVRLDDMGIAEKATNILLQAGHRNVGAILKLDDGQGRLRYAGYMKALFKASADFRESQVAWIDSMDYRDLSAIEEHIFSRMKNVTGVVCYNDEVAYQLIDLALKRGLRIPEDLSVVSIDDSHLAGVSRVPFTSFPHPKDLLGRKAAENMIRMIDQPEFDGNFLFDCEPVIRDSVRVLTLEGENGNARRTEEKSV